MANDKSKLAALFTLGRTRITSFFMPTGEVRWFGGTQDKEQAQEEAEKKKRLQVKAQATQYVNDVVIPSQRVVGVKIDKIG